jgi:alpha-L-fucosidase 2
MLYYSWEKAWRAACWAALGNATQAQYELQLTIQRDFEVRSMFFLFFFFCYIINEEILTCLQGNLFDNYSADVFQIDANLGYPAAVMVCIILTTSEIFW